MSTYEDRSAAVAAVATHFQETLPASPPGPSTSGGAGGQQRKRTPLIFCVHGNKFGVARCCEDWGAGGSAGGGDGLNERTPLLGAGSAIRANRSPVTIAPTARTMTSSPSNVSSALCRNCRGSRGARSSSIMDEKADDDSSSSTDSDHCHRSREEGVDKVARNQLIRASVFCVFFMIGECVGGVLASSLAVASDAAHLLTDLASFMISLLAIWLAGRPATKQLSFGWHRAEVIGATISVLLIWVVTGILVYMAVQRVITRDFEVNGLIMLITSGVGVIINIFMGLTLHQPGHGHAHGGGGGGGDEGHSHGGGGGGGGGPLAFVKKMFWCCGSSANNHDGEAGGGGAHGPEARKENINVKAAFIHVLGDFIQSIGVFIAALVIYFKPEWDLVDPICTFFFSVLVLFTTVKILRDTGLVLMEGLPRGISFQLVKDTFMSVDGIVMVHSLRIWGITTNKSAIAAHLAIRPGADPQTVLREATTRIRAKYDFYEMTLQIEVYQGQMDECDQCQTPER